MKEPTSFPVSLSADMNDAGHLEWSASLTMSTSGELNTVTSQGLTPTAALDNLHYLLRAKLEYWRQGKTDNPFRKPDDYTSK